MAAPADLPLLFDSFFTSPCCSQYDGLQLSESQCLSALQSPPARTLFGLDQPQSPAVASTSEQPSFPETLRQNIRRMFERLEHSSQEQSILRSRLLHIGYAGLCSFLQADVTGPPLAPSAINLIFPVGTEQSRLDAIREQMIRDLTVDGEAAYQLIPLVELFVVAKTVLNCAEIMPPNDSTLIPRLARLRVNFLHQKILSEDTDSLRHVIYEDLDALQEIVLVPGKNDMDKVKFLLERAAIHTHHGQDEKARRDLERAADLNGFEFAVTGRLGKRTKFQTRDITQLVVLAKSRDSGDSNEETNGGGEQSKPTKLDLNDDTLLESISFAENGDSQKTEKSLTVQDESSLPSSLSDLDPSHQPQLSTLDSITLLSIASAITNTSPDHGLTREETLPYATRVLDSGSTNWQVYSQALLVRSRIEGHASRTVERSVLQLQALVDQVIADTNSSMYQSGKSTEAQEPQSTTFLPRPQTSESAPAVERLKYLWYVDFSTRWGLEAELAQRWVSLGGLRTALEIYERLHMWAEAALCHAATDREDQARAIVRRQLFQSSTANDEDSFDGPELDVLPPDAPRLFCILGDIETDPTMYERAWEVSKQRYARAQRSLARYYVSQKPPAFEKAEEAYKKSLHINRLNHGAWFALGCIQLELEKWTDAVEAFTRAVQQEESDAEAWSNLAAALVNVPPPSGEDQAKQPRLAAEDEEEAPPKPVIDRYKPKRDALAALHRAARFKHDDHRIWDNMITVASSIPPPHTPFRDILLAFRRTIEIRGPKKGEKSVDVTVLSALVGTLTADYSFDDPQIISQDNPRQLRPGTLPAAILNLVDEAIVPLITHSPQLWLLVSRVESWRARPVRALEAHEKAWRAAVASSSRGAFEMGEEKEWMAIVASTETLVRKGYAVFGGMEKEQNDDDVEAPSSEGELVAKDWRFKSRSAVRGILGKGKEFWEGTEGWDRLKELAADVSGGNH